ncbi:MAG TPA: M28 family metallopeptidase [Gemmatimonadaceae bacterium]|nr:M28 family metallopeptidase [Gemmatimonadaceae bacterium]
MRPIRYWAAATLLIGGLLALIAWRERPPRAKRASIPTTEFSAERAWRVLAYLADTIGYRVSGTPGARRAEEYLAARLREVPGVEVEVQEVSGARATGRRLIGYTLHNVLARIPGRSRDAVLISAHYDTPVESVGAGDDGVAAASLVELVRALAAGPELEHSIIVIINDGEEQGLLGSHGFVRHPWFRDVRAFVNLESAGPHGKSILFQAGVGGGWLVSEYARSVPYPYGTVLGQDIFQSGAIPSDTDFRIYRDFGHLVGLDIALYRGGWAYHTQRDRTWNVSPGSVQQMGENALALARELASGPIAARDGGSRAVYYDVIGLFMLHYGERTARVIAALATVLAIVALVLAFARGVMSVRATALELLALVAAAVVAMLAAIALSAMAAYVLGRPMSWYAHPWWGVSAFAMAALGGALAVQWAARGRRDADVQSRAHAAHGALVIFWTIVLAILSVERIGSAYIALWWVVGLALALLAAALDRGRRWRLWFVIGALPAGMLTLQLLVLLAMLFVPVFGRLPLPIAPDLVLAAMIAVPAVAVALALLPGARVAARHGLAAVVALAAALLLMGVSLLQPRYTERRAQRLAVVHYQDGGESELRVYGMDYMTPRLALATDSAMHPAPGSGERPLEFVAPAGPTGFIAPSVEIVAEKVDSAASLRPDNSRTVTLRVRSKGAYRVTIMAPRVQLLGWRLAPASAIPFPTMQRGAGPAADPYLRLDWVAPPDTGLLLSLTVRGSEGLTLHVAASHFTTTTAAAALRRTLPPWTDFNAIAVTGEWWKER